jgi:hypothetical protein
VLPLIRSDRRPSREPIEIDARQGRTIDRSPKRFIFVKRLEIRIAARQRTVLRVERNRAFQMRYRFGMLASLGVRDSEHVERMIVVGILIANQTQM